jgi:hypothetical protein
MPKGQMSADRIEFQFIPYSSTGTDREQVQARAAYYAFRLNPVQVKRAADSGQRIVCRPSQFGRFIAKRAELIVQTRKNTGANICNDTANLCVMSIPPVPEKEEPLDVSYSRGPDFNG